MRRFVFAALLASVLAACHGAGPYGHAVNYAPLSDEEKELAGAKEYDPVMFQRKPEEWRGKSVSLFGVVSGRTSGPGGGAYLTLSVRRLEPRNLCDSNADEETCRVTVSDSDFGVVRANVVLKGDDDLGEHSVGGGSLGRVVGTFGEDIDPNDGSPVMRVTYYRHWPRYFFVTKAASSQMRQ
ncbi:hypothetical protein BH09MYX1_BH09MYX1_23600 [soil metagenome]